MELANRPEQQFSEKSDADNGLITIEATESIGIRMLAKIIHRFSERYPLVRFHMYNEMADNIKDRLDKGLVDIGLLLEPVDVQKYDYLRLSQKETWGILMRTDHPLASHKQITPEDIIPYALILPLREKVREDILNRLGKEEKYLCILLNYTLLSNAVLLVEEKLDCAFCLDGALAVRSSPNLKFIPIYLEKTTRSILV